MRAFKGVNLKTIDDPATRTAFQALDHYTRQTGRALSRNASGVTNITIFAPGGGEVSPGTVFVDSTWRITDNVAPTKAMRFEVGEVSPGTTRTLTVPDQNGTIALLSDIPAAVGTHNILDDTVHLDTLTGTVVRGDLIVGNSTPKWARFPKGSSGAFLKQGADDPTWTSIAEGDITDGSLLARVGSNETISGTWTWGAAFGFSSDGVRQTTLNTLSNVLDGQILYRNSGSDSVVGLAIGGANTFLKSDGSDPYYDTIQLSDLPTLTTAEIPEHGASLHTDRTRSVWIPNAVFGGSQTGTNPDAYAWTQMPTAVDTYLHLAFLVPQDYVSDGLLRIYLTMSGNDINDVVMKLYTKVISVTESMVGAYDDEDDMTFSSPLAANTAWSTEATISSSYGADDLLRWTIFRDGTSDSNADAVRIMCMAFHYTADM